MHAQQYSYQIYLETQGQALQPYTLHTVHTVVGTELSTVNYLLPGNLRVQV